LHRTNNFLLPIQFQGVKAHGWFGPNAVKIFAFDLSAFGKNK
jgi:hypothetical protein